MSNLDSGHVVSKSITVALNVERAFQIWTEQIGVWWPAGHSRSGDPKTQVFIEGKVGGRFFERASTGTKYDWGAVEVWDPPHHLTLAWYLGSSPELPTRVEVRFVALNNGETRIEIEHRGPELIGELWWLNNAKYSVAWDKVLPNYAAVCQHD